MLDSPTLLFLAGLFLCISYLSASVGLGGGSSYTALMAVSGVSPLTIPLVSLMMNLLVTSAGSFQFILHRHACWRLIAPFLLSSMPMAYLGGSLSLPKPLFYGILFTSLLVVVARIFLFKETTVRFEIHGWKRFVLCLLAGSVLGFLSGVVGIGGGIYLVPLIIILGLGTEKQAAASGAIFIWINSAIGLLARIQHHAINPLDYLPLFLAVSIGGLFVSFMGAAKLKPLTMQKILGSIIVVALCLLARKLV